MVGCVVDVTEGLGCGMWQGESQVECGDWQGKVWKGIGYGLRSLIVYISTPWLSIRPSSLAVPLPGVFSRSSRPQRR